MGANGSIQALNGRTEGYMRKGTENFLAILRPFASIYSHLLNKFVLAEKSLREVLVRGVNLRRLFIGL